MKTGTILNRGDAKTFTEWYAKILVMVFVVFVLTLITGYCLNNVSGDEVSLKDLKYEIIDGSDYNVTDRINRAEIYSYADNISENQYGYYNLSKVAARDNFLLADTTYFNFSSYDKLWIDYFIPDDEEITIEFKYSFVFGNGSVFDKQYVAMYKDWFLSERYFHTRYNDTWENTFINLYYSQDNFIPVDSNGLRNTNFDADELLAVQGESRTAGLVYHNVTLPINTQDNFQRFSVDIRNNFAAYYPELNLFNEIWLTNVTNIYIKDFGFSKDEWIKEPEIWSDGNYSYYMLYGENQFMIDVNQSDRFFQELSDVEFNMFGFSLFDYTANNYHINSDVSTFTTPRYDYNLYDYTLLYGDHDTTDFYPIFNYTIPDTGTTFYNDPYMVILQSNYFWDFLYESDMAHTGFHIYLNELSLAFHLKYYFNIIHADEIYEDGTTTAQLTYSEPKFYWGFFYNRTLGNLTVDKTYMDLTIVEDSFNDVDSAFTNQKKSEEKFYQLGGDWGSFDAIRKGINKVIEVVSLVVGGVVSFLSPLFDALNTVVSTLEDIGSDINTALTPLFTALESAINSVGTAIGNLATQLTTEVNALLSKMNELLAQLGILSALSELSAWIQDIADAVASGASQLLDFVNSGIAWIQAYADMFLTLITQMTLLLNEFVEIYIYIIILLTTFRIFADMGAGFLHSKEIVYDFMYLIALPLIVIYTVIIQVGGLIGNFTPFT